MPTTINRDLYEVLEVSESASQSEIRKAYLEFARKYHPDKTGGDIAAEEKLKEINAAYGVLKNTEKREKYDQERKFAGRGFGGSGGFGPTYGRADASEFSGIFSSIFGSGAPVHPYSMAHAGRSLEARLSVTLKDIVSGTTKTLRIRRQEVCDDCGGSGAAPGTSPVPCPDCGGAGRISHGNGMFSMAQTCPRCRGTGKTIANPCNKCGGTGRTKAVRRLNIDIPAGADEGTRLRIASEGDAGHNGAPRGDLYVQIEIESDPFFTREGRNLICEVPITFAEAALGAKISAPTLQGIAKVTVKPGTQTGSRLRMRGMGLPSLGGGPRGDEFIKILVEVPRKLTRDQIRLLKEFDGNYQPRSHPLRDKFDSLLRKFRKAI